MKRTMCGGFLLAGLIVSSGCSGDPTGDLLGSGITLQPSPSSLFMGQGDQEAVTVSVVDAQGNEQDITGFSFEAGAGIAVTEDTTYLRTNAGGQLGTSKRLFIEGLSATATQVTLTANGQTSTVPVRVTPVGATVTLSNAAPAAGEGLVITLPAGYKFGTAGGASVDGTAGITTAVAPDSSSATVLLPPGTTGTIQVDSVAVDFVPGVLFSLPTTETVTVGPTLTAMPGTGSPATAPVITIPPPGATGGFFDAAPLAAATCGGNSGFPCQLYQFTLAEETTFEVNMTWSNTADLGLYFLTADGTTDTGAACDDHGNAAEAQPEHCEITLPAGTYLAGIVNFGPAYVPPDPNPDWVGLGLLTH
jgi:hypothetical protein